MEKVGSNKLICSLPGYKHMLGGAQDIFGILNDDTNKDLSDEEVSEMLDNLSTELTSELRLNSESSAKACSQSDDFLAGLKSSQSEQDWEGKAHPQPTVSKAGRDERGYKRIHAIGTLPSKRPDRMRTQAVYERKSGEKCYLLDPGKSKFTLNGINWKKNQPDMNYITIFDDYDEKGSTTITNADIRCKYKITPNQVIFLTKNKLPWDTDLTFLQAKTRDQEDQTNPESTETRGSRSKLAGMSKNSYKHEQKKADDLNIEDELLEEIAEKRRKVMEQKPVDRDSPEWKKKVWDLMRERFSKRLKDELDQPDKKTLKTDFETEFHDEAGRYHEEGCPTPEYQLEKAGVSKKKHATWKVLPYFNLSHLDNIRLQWIVSEEVRKGNLLKWEPGMDLPLHASPAFIAARKGHLTGRMVVDFRVYNQMIEIPCFSMPNSENILNDLTSGDAKYFGASDLATGYFHAQLDDSEIPYLAVTTQDGIYFSRKLQLGPSWAPAWFQSRSRSAFPPEFHGYIDDILFKARTAEELLERIKTIHQSCKRTGFVLSLKKTHYGVEEVEALGHNVTTSGRCAAAGKIKLIDGWEFPKTSQNLKSFVCVLVYLRDYIWRFAEKVYPLKKYLRGKNPTPISELATDDNAKRAIQLLKNSIAKQATVKHLDRVAACDYKNTGRPVIVYVDASQYAKCFVVCQRPTRDKNPQIAVYKARSFSDAERKWSTLERELNAMLYFVEEGIRYIEGIPTILLFDHKNLGEEELQSIWCNKQKSDKISRWCDRIIGSLQKLQIRRHYLPGQLNLLADVGSRYGHDTTTDRDTIPSNVSELIKTLFNTNDTDAKSLKELVKQSQEDEKNPVLENACSKINAFTDTVDKLAAISLIAKLAATEGENKISEKDFEKEDPLVFDNEKVNNATISAYKEFQNDFDTSEWRDETHYEEEKYYYEDQISAMEQNAESDLKVLITTAKTPRGYSYQGIITGENLNMKDDNDNPTTAYSHWETYEKTNYNKATTFATSNIVMSGIV